jgi:hypothetical protein
MKNQLLPVPAPLEPATNTVSAGPLEPASSPTVDGGTQPAGTILPAEEPKRELEDLARECGELAKPAPDGGKYLWRHNVASFLHGWGQHEYHQNCKVTLTLTDYKAALAAVDTQTTHGPAVRKADKA